MVAVKNNKIVCDCPLADRCSNNHKLFDSKDKESCEWFNDLLINSYNK